MIKDISGINDILEKEDFWVRDIESKKDIIAWELHVFLLRFLSDFYVDNEKNKLEDVIKSLSITLNINNMFVIIASIIDRKDVYHLDRMVDYMISLISSIQESIMEIYVSDDEEYVASPVIVLDEDGKMIRMIINQSTNVIKKFLLIYDTFQKYFMVENNRSLVKKYMIGSIKF